MKKKLYNLLFLFSLLLMLSSCDQKARLVKSLKPEIESELKKGSTTNYEVEDIVLIKESGNKYSGVVKIKEPDGVYDYDIEVVSDGESYRWEMPRTPLQREALKNFEKELDQMQKDTEREIDRAIEQSQKDFDDAMNKLQNDYDF